MKKSKIILFVLCCIGAIVYAIPNFYPKAPVIEIVDADYKEITTKVPEIASYKYISGSNKVSIIFNNIPEQIAYANTLKQHGFTASLNLLDRTPNWLKAINANPIKLGLDLQGGIRLMLSAKVEQLVEKYSTQYYLELKDFLYTNKYYYKSISEQAGTVNIEFEAVEPRLISSLKKDFSKYYKIDFSGNLATLKLKIENLAELEKSIMDKTIQVINKRVNEIGVSEAIVQAYGNNSIIIELPGVQDPNYAKNIIGKTAQLEFRTVADGSALGAEKIYGSDGKLHYINLKNHLTGDAVINAKKDLDSVGMPSVAINITNKDAISFKKFTRNNIGKLLAVIYKEQTDDGEVKKVISVATIKSELSDSFQISGNMSNQEAEELALLLRTGSLPVATKIVEEKIVGPSLGEANIKSSFKAMVFGMVFISIFMVAYYRVAGFYANVSLLLNLFLLLFLLSSIGATLTLPGIAGIVLTLGMAIDSNVLIFERVKEELSKGNNKKDSMLIGFKDAWNTIFDSNITTLLAGIVLFTFGDGPVKGFAITLCLGILTTLFTSVYASRLLCFSHQNYFNNLSIGYYEKKY